MATHEADAARRDPTPRKVRVTGKYRVTLTLLGRTHLTDIPIVVVCDPNEVGQVVLEMEVLGLSITDVCSGRFNEHGDALR